jgi:hypothetical protein
MKGKEDFTTKKGDTLKRKAFERKEWRVQKSIKYFQRKT